MRLKREHQQRLLDLLYEDFGEVKRYTPKAWDGWEFVKDFDRHSPCRNLLIATPNGSEVKIFVPNSHIEDWDNEEFDRWLVWFDVYGMGEDEEPLEFDSIEEVVGYLLEQWDNNNI
jgi:hypothetical protein